VSQRRSYVFPDAGVTSADGRLRFEVRTREPDRARWLPHRRVREYRLVETATLSCETSSPYRSRTREPVLWRRTEKATHPWPWCVYVHDDGTAAVLLADDELRVFHPGGETGPTVSVLAALQADPRTRTRAGPGWDAYPKGLFVTLRGRLHLVLRAFWGGRAVIDARTGALTPVTPAIEPTLAAAEAAWALDRLTQTAQHGAPLPFWTRFAAHGVRETIAAAQLAGQARLLAAAPLLQRLRHAPPEAAAVTETEESPYRPGAGEIDIRCHVTSRGRRAIQVALLRLGLPAAEPAAYFFFAGPMWQGRRHDPGPRPRAWAEALLRVRPGTQPRELLARAGAPFFVRGEAWDYDVVEGEARTLRVAWGREGVRSVRVVAPEWVTGHERDALA
jgi:hypothetical protein